MFEAAASLIESAAMIEEYLIVENVVELSQQTALFRLIYSRQGACASSFASYNGGAL